MKKASFPLALLAVLLLLTACGSQPAWYVVPAQRGQTAIVEPWDGAYISLSDPRTFDAIVADIDTEISSSPWRWGKRNPTVRVLADPNKSYDIAVKGSFAEQVRQQTGPLTVRIFFDDTLVATKVLQASGTFEWKLPLNGKLLNGAREHQIRLSLDKVFVAPDDKAQLGLILEGIGLQSP